jgi:bifunctional DNase/RNase
MQEMTVYGVSFDLVGKQPIVLLRTAGGKTYLPIWIGPPEAAAILMRLQGQEPPRPLTHDLVCSIIDSLDAEVERVTVTELRDSTFYARITLVRNGTEIEIDSRTSDAIAIALRADAKIFAEDEVIEESGVEFEGDEPDLDYAHRVSLGEVDMDEFRQFPTSSPRAPRTLQTDRPYAPPSSRFVSARSSSTRRSSPSCDSGPSLRSASCSRSRRSRSGSRRASPRSAFNRHSSSTSRRRRFTAPTIAASFAAISFRISSNRSLTSTPPQ